MAVGERLHLVKEEAFTPAAKSEAVPAAPERNLSRQEKRVNGRKAIKDLLKKSKE